MGRWGFGELWVPPDDGRPNVGGREPRCDRHRRAGQRGDGVVSGGRTGGERQRSGRRAGRCRPSPGFARSDGAERIGLLGPINAGVRQCKIDRGRGQPDFGRDHHIDHKRPTGSNRHQPDNLFVGGWNLRQWGQHDVDVAVDRGDRGPGHPGQRPGEVLCRSAAGGGRSLASKSRLCWIDFFGADIDHDVHHDDDHVPDVHRECLHDSLRTGIE